MKKVSIICLLSFILIFTAGFFIGKWNYPNKQPAKMDNQDANISLNLAASTAQSTTTCDTIYIVQSYHKATGLTTTDIQTIPAQYIDQTREQMIHFLEMYEKAPTLQDRKDGFLSIRLLSFSPEKITILKTYQELSKKNGFYLIARDAKIMVYYADKERIYFETELTLEDFPESLQTEFIHGKYFDSEQDVYSFLESYTS